MPHYRCIVSDEHGKRKSRIMDANSEQELILSFNYGSAHLISFSIIEEDKILHEKKHFRKNTIIEFTEIMHSLLKSGLTVQDSLTLCKSISSGRQIPLLCATLLHETEKGKSFHQALQLLSPSFSPLYCSLVSLGEKTGSISAIFGKLCSYLKSEQKIQDKIKHAMIYPAFIIFAVVILCLAILFIFMPRMGEIFLAFNTGAGDEVIRKMNSVYNSMALTIILFFLLFFSSIALRIWYAKSGTFSLTLDSAVLKIPYLGTFIKSLQTLDFSFAMSILTSSGINVSSALRESSAVASNKAYGAAVDNVYRKLLKGEQLSGLFREFREFPDYISTWVAVGEKTGSVELAFSQIHDYFQSNVEQNSEMLMNLIEPFFTVIAGIVVIVMIIQFVMPLFSLYGNLI